MVSASRWKIASARIVALLREPGGRPDFRCGLFQMSSGSLLVVHPKLRAAADRGHEKTPARFPARGTLREFQFRE
jgi:hypothetical protein